MPPNAKPTAVVMLIDDWFPKKRPGVGVYGGGQVHVRQLRRLLKKDHGCLTELFYGGHANPVIRLLWPLLVVIQIIIYSRNKRVDVLHAHGLKSALAAKLTGLITRKPVIVTVHGSPLIDQGIKSFQAKIEKYILTGISYDAQISAAHQFLKHPNKNQLIKVVPNGVDMERFNRVKVKRYRQPSLIWVGKEDKVKGLPVLKEAILKVRKKIPNLKAELVANGDLTGAALIRAYKRAHVFVLPSLAEGQSLTLLEAWAAKLPVVVTKVGDNPLMVKNGINGYLVEPGSARQLAITILKVLRAKVKNREMGEAGYRLVSKEYTWERTAVETLAVYREVIGRYEVAKSKIQLTGRISPPRYS